MNSHTLYKILLSSLVVFLLGACVEDESALNPAQRPNVRVKLEVTGQTSSRAQTDPGVDALNENVIESLDLFLYQKGGISRNEEAVYVQEDVTLTQDEETGDQYIEFFLTNDQLSSLFPTEAATECDLYAIANRGDNELPDDTKVGSLKEMVLYSSTMGIRRTVQETGKYLPGIESSFVMEGETALSRSGDELGGTVHVERVASKISLVITGIADEVTDENGVVWIPNKSSVFLSFRKGCKKAKLGVTPTEHLLDADDLVATDIFNVDAISLEEIDGMENCLGTSVPFYTYPTNWKNNEDTRSHFILVVQWSKKKASEEEADVTQTTYYEVNINPEGTYLKRNTHYKINQIIEVLGSTEEESPKELILSNYQIVEWADEQSSHADLNRFKYLMVDETSITMDNVETKRIYFYSSDPIGLSDVNVQWEYLAGDVAETLTFATMNHVTSSNINGDVTYVVENNNKVTVDNRVQGDHVVSITIHNGDPANPDDDSYIDVTHELDNSMSSTADYTNYMIDFTVAHIKEDGFDTNYTEQVAITQSPMISIVANRNSDYDNDNNKNGNKGFVIVNNNTSGSGWNGVVGMNFSKNPNRYIISVSSLTNNDVGRNYIIGDPRSKTVRNPSGTGLDDLNNSLSHYYPTDASTTNAQMISPQFMVASSYGACPDSNMGKDVAERRCATYQEDGYPAGRWRVPTKAEIRYITQLSGWDIIPELFSDGMFYWSAQGCIEIDGNNVLNADSRTSGLVRCVYDTWYWGTGQLTNKNQFTYGDAARNNNE